MTNRVADINGYYTIERNPISAAGVFPYTKKSIGFPGWEDDPGGIVEVWRPAEELADPETLKSFELLPWTDEHAMIGNPETDASLTPIERKGAHGTTGQRIEFDPTDQKLYANIKLWSSSLADAIDAGKKDLSMGFRCVYEFVSGIFEGRPFQAIQRCLRGNHQATVPDGRVPGAMVLDHFSFALDASELREVKPMAKVTRRVALAKKLSVSPTALAAAVGMDKADAATLATWNTAMDAEEDDAPADDEGGSSGMTLEDIADVLGEVGPSLAKINDALAAMAGAPAEDPEDPDAATLGVDDDMEPMLDAMGKPMMDAAGAPMMKKKAAPVADASGLAACDAAIAAMEVQSKIMRKTKGADKLPALAAMDAAIVTAKSNRAKIAAKRPAVRRAGTGTDAALLARVKTAEDSLALLTGGGFIKGAMQHMAQRDALAKRISNFTGAFDHAEMTVAEVAAYGAGKFGLKSKDVSAVEAYLHNRQPEAPVPGAAFGLDSAPNASSKVSNFLAGSIAA